VARKVVWQVSVARAGITVLLAALTTAACVTPIRRQTWLRARSENFEIISSASAERTRAMALRLELFRATLLEVIEREDIRAAQPTLTYLFGDGWTYRRFRRRSGVEGFMLPTAWRNYLVINASRGDDAFTTAQHEYVHFALRNTGSRSYPPWYDEGFSELLSTAHVEGDAVVIGSVPPERASWLMYGTPLTLRRILTAREVLRWPDRALGMFYAQSWALAHLLHWGHHHGYPDRRGAVLDYLRLVEAGLDEQAAFERAFETPIREVEGELLEFVARGQTSQLALEGERISHSPQVTLEPLAQQDKLYLVAELAFAVEQHRLAEKLLRRAVARDPGDARAASALAMLVARDGGRETAALVERASALTSDDALARLWLAEAERQHALHAPQAARAAATARARVRYQEILAEDPASTGALTGLGRTYVDAPGDARDGIRALESARAALPGDEDVVVALSQLYLQDGDPQRARETLRTALSSARDRPFDSEALADLLERSGLGTDPIEPGPVLEPQLEVHAPQTGQQLRELVRLVEVRGRAGLGELLAQDVVIAIDESNTTLHATGQDVDGDGRRGRSSREPQWQKRAARWSSDPDDSIIRAELMAARTFLDRLHPDETRAAVLTFSKEARVRAPLGSTAEAAGAIDAYKIYVDRTGTSLAAPLEAAVEALVAAGRATEVRQRSVILFSDGQPTVPSVASGRKQAREAADVLGHYGIRVFAFGLGKDAVRTPDTFEEIAKRTGGHYVPLEQPGDIVAYAQRISLTGLEGVEIRNETTGGAARALRLFPDGSFDAYVDVVPGANTLAIVARLEDGARLTERVTVGFAAPDQPTAAHRERASRLREQLRARTLETELMRRARQGREAELEVELEIEVDEKSLD
jgi:tetratricopeptide (TPR) repeat protein